MKKRIIIVGCVVMVITVGTFLAYKLSSNKEQEASPQEEKKLEAEITDIEGEDFIGKLPDGAKINTNATMNKESDLGNLHFSNIRLTLKYGTTTFRANVTNNGESITELKNVTLKLYDEDGNELVSAKGLIDKMDAGQTSELDISVTTNVLNASRYELLEN